MRSFSKREASTTLSTRREVADVVCIGEALIDLVPVTGAGGDETFVKAAGGAPANVAVGLARLGIASAFIGTVGDDALGRYLTRTLASHGVETKGIRVTTAAPTALAVVTLDPDGERDFLFYGHPAAHALLTQEEIDETMIAAAKLVHFGTITLVGGPARDATLHAIDLAHRHGVRVGFDPNLRLPLWPDAAAAIEAMRLGIAAANVVKLSEDELRFLQGDSCDLVEAARALWHPGLELMTVTLGRKGCLWLDPIEEGEVAGFAVEAIDTTGAGDAFTAALLAGLIRHRDLDGLGRDALSGLVRFANAAGALATMQRGAIPALPDRDAVERLLHG